MDNDSAEHLGGQIASIKIWIRPMVNLWTGSRQYRSEPGFVTWWALGESGMSASYSQISDKLIISSCGPRHLMSHESCHWKNCIDNQIERFLFQQVSSYGLFPQLMALIEIVIWETLLVSVSRRSPAKMFEWLEVTLECGMGPGSRMWEPKTWSEGIAGIRFSNFKNLILRNKKLLLLSSWLPIAWILHQ